MPAGYIAPISTASWAGAAQVDVFEITAATGRPCELIAVVFGQTSDVGDAAEEIFQFRYMRYSGAPTSGSGGSAPVFRSLALQGVSAGPVIEISNTTKCSGGTSEELARDTWNVRQQYIYKPVPEEIIRFAGGEKLVMEMLTNPADALSNIGGYVCINEL